MTTTHSAPRQSDAAAASFAEVLHAEGPDPEREAKLREGPDPRGGSMRWTFTELEPDSFHWTGERAPDGKSWRLEVDIRRTASDGRTASDTR